MIRLFDKGTEDFSKIGIGVVSDAYECKVDEEVNGPYELEMKYPATGSLFKVMKNGNIIFCKPNPFSREQAFVIDNVEKEIDKTVTINAKHISYQLSYIPVLPFEAEFSSEVFNKIQENALEECPFTFWSGITKRSYFVFDDPKSVRAILGDGDESLIGVFGGELEFDNFSVKHHASRGLDNGVTIRYGKDLISLTQEETIEESCTGIAPYWRGNIKTAKNAVSEEGTIRNGYFSKDSYTFTEDNGFRSAEFSVAGGSSLEISTVIRRTDIAGVIFYNSSNAVVSYELLGSGETDEITDLLITVPEAATKMVLNSCVATDPIAVARAEINVPLTVSNGYYSLTEYKRVVNSNYRCAIVNVEKGQKYRITTKLGPTDIAAVVFYNRVNSVISYFLRGDGSEQEVSNYEFIVPADSYRMAVNSATTDAPSLIMISNTVNDDVNVIVSLREKVIHIEGASDEPYPRTVPVDLSSEFDYQPSEVELREAAQQYLIDHPDISAPKVNLTISAADLRKVVEYSGIDTLTPIKIGDTVKVIFEDLGVSGSREIIKTSYDVLRDEYISIELGDQSAGLSDTIANISSGASSTKAAVTSANDIAESALSKANSAEEKANEALSKITRSNDHRTLEHRDAANQHPIASIYRLPTELWRRVLTEDYLTNVEIDSIITL